MKTRQVVLSGRALGSAVVMLLGVTAAVDQLSGGLLRDWIRHSREPDLSDLVVFLVLLLLAAAVSFFFLLLVLRLIERRNWFRSFKYAGKAKRAFLPELAPQRRMEIPFVELKRRLLAPQRMGGNPGSQFQSPVLSEDAARFLSECISDRQWRQTHWGFLIQGKISIGKTRLAVEWIRARFPRGIILWPSTGKLPNASRQLRKWKQRNVFLILDDLQDFDQILPEIRQFVSESRQLGVDVVILATVRDGPPSGQIFQAEAFNGMRERLHHVYLAPPAPSQQRLVSSYAGEPLPQDPYDREPGFSWLLHKQYEEMQRRYHDVLTAEGRALLRTAKLLDVNHIPISRGRWIEVLVCVFRIVLEPNEEADAFLELAEQGFLKEGVDLPEPCYIRHVINGRFDWRRLQADLEACLTRLEDAEGLFYWGMSLGSLADANQRDATRAASLLRRCQEVAKRDPARLTLAAEAGLRLGVLLEESDRHAAETAYRDTVTDGRRSGDAKGLALAAEASISLGLIFEDSDRAIAEESYRVAQELGAASATADGLEQASRAAYHASLLQYKQRNR